MGYAQAFDTSAMMEVHARASPPSAADGVPIST